MLEMKNTTTCSIICIICNFERAINADMWEKVIQKTNESQHYLTLDLLKAFFNSATTWPNSLSWSSSMSPLHVMGYSSGGFSNQWCNTAWQQSMCLSQCSPAMQSRCWNESSSSPISRHLNDILSMRLNFCVSPLSSLHRISLRCLNWTWPGKDVAWRLTYDSIEPEGKCDGKGGRQKSFNCNHS